MKAKSIYGCYDDLKKYPLVPYHHLLINLSNAAKLTDKTKIVNIPLVKKMNVVPWEYISKKLPKKGKIVKEPATKTITAEVYAKIYDFSLSK